MKTILEQLTANASEIREERAKRLVKTLEMSQRSMSDGLKSDIMRLEAKIESHTDFGRTSTTSMVVKLEEGTNSDAWVKEYQGLKIALVLKKQELIVAKESYKQLFGKKKNKENVVFETISEEVLDASVKEVNSKRKYTPRKK